MIVSMVVNAFKGRNEDGSVGAQVSIGDALCEACSVIGEALHGSVCVGSVLWNASRNGSSSSMKDDDGWWMSKKLSLPFSLKAWRARGNIPVGD